MARIVIYDEVNGKILKYIPSAHTPDFEDRSDVLVNPDIKGINIRSAVVENGQLRNMTEEEAALALAEDEKIRYKEYRQRAYPDLLNQLDMLWNEINENGVISKNGQWYNEIKNVKERYPKV